MIIAPGNKNIIMKTGIFKIRIHLPTCLEIFETIEYLFMEISLVINEKNKAVNNWGAIVNNRAIGRAALYNPTSAVPLKYPKKKVSNQYKSSETKPKKRRGQE